MSLVAWYPLNGNTNDYSGNQLHATNNGATIDNNGKIGKTYLFNGSNNILTPLNSDMFNQVSISFWVYNYNAGGAGLIGTHSGGRTLNFYRYPTLNDFHWSTQGSVGVDAGVLPFNKWTHIMVVCDGSSLKRYYNGVYYGVTAGGVARNASTIYIGSNDSGYSNVKLNDIRIYDHALSEKEIKEIAKAKILHYTFDDFQEPTTNMIPSIVTPVYGSWGVNTGTSTAFVAPSGRNGVYLKITSFTDGGVNWYNSGGSFKASPSTVYTVSAYLKSTASFHTNAFYLRQYRVNGTQITEGGQYSSSFREDLGGGWYRAYGVFTTSSECDKFLIEGYQYSSGEFWIYDLQVEQKNYYTPFVFGSRAGNINDSSGFRNNATLTEATTPRWVSDSKIGSGAYYFNGSTTKIDLNNLSTSDNKLTISAWVYTKTLSKTSAIIRKENSFLLQTNTSGQFRPHVYINGSWHSLTTAINTIQLNTWQLLSAVYDGVNLIAYVNGQEIQRTSLTGFINPSSNITAFGYHATTEWHDGYLDDIRIYATALSDSDILELYQTRASVDSNGNLFIGEINENTLNRCPPFEEWTLSGGASLNNGILSMPLGSNAQSPYIYIGLNSNWSFRADYFAVEQSNYISHQPNAGYLMGSQYYDSLLNPTPNTENYSANGHTGSYPINTWTTKAWSYLGGNLIEYIKVNISADSTYGQPSGFKTKSPMLTTDPYSGKYINYSSRIVDKTENTKLKLFDSGVFDTNEASEVGITEGLIAYYPFDKDARDYSGNAYHGTVSGAVLSGGIKGWAYSFNPGYITFPKLNLTSGLLDFSVGMFLKIDSYISNAVPFSFFGEYQTMYTFEDSLPISTLGYRCNMNATWQTPVNVGTLQLNTWYHVFTTYSASSGFKMYLNGQLVSSSSTTGTISTYTGTNQIGALEGTRMFDGSIDEVRVYNRVLSAEEVAILYETTAPSTAAMKITKDTVYLKGEFKEVI